MNRVVVDCGMGFKVSNIVGAQGEHLALQEYLKADYRLVAQNFYNPTGKRLGEIDIIVEKHGVIVFVEVKTRTGFLTNQAEAVTPQKQQRLLRAVEWFLYKNQQYLNHRPRIDVCLVNFSKIDKTKKSVIILSNAVTLDY